MIRWLHISDLHICEQADWNNYKKELLKKCKEIGKIDFVVVTGDYHDFKDGNNFQGAENFLKNFIRDLGLDISRDLFMIPGNHDGVTELEDNDTFVTAARAEPMNSIRVDKLLKMYTDYELFVKSVIPDYPDEHPAAVHVRTWNDKVTLIHCNTAIGANGKDKEGQILDINGLASLNISDKRPAIILAHNSFFDLHVEHQKRVKDFIRVNNVRAYLCGDRHIRQVEQISYEDNQNKQIPCIVSYKASPDVADKYSSFGIIIGEWEGSEAVLKGWTWESGKGFQTDGSICGKKIEMGSIPVDVPSGAVKKKSYQLEKKYDGWLQINVDLEQRKFPNSTESMKDFLIGHPCKWSLAFSGLTVRRRQLDELLEKIKAGGINALLGAGAEGKSTLLKQACVQLYYEGYTVLYHVKKSYKLPKDLPDNTVLVIDDPDNDKKFVEFMNYAYSYELPLVIAARRNEWNLFCDSRKLSSEIKRAVTKINMKNITDRKEAEAFADCVIRYYKKDADREKLIHIFLRNANDFGFLYAAMLISIYDKSQFEEIAKDIIDNIEKNNKKAMKLLAYAVMFEHLGTTLSSKEYDDYLNCLEIAKRNAKDALELELRHTASHWETRHPQISNLFYEIFFGEDAKFKPSEADELRHYVVETLLKRYNRYYSQRNYVFEYILSSIELINMSSSSDWILERIVEEFKEDEDKLHKIRSKLDDSLNAKFGELCYAREIYDAEIIWHWAKAVYNINGAGDYDTENSALWIYRTACLEVKVSDYGIWLEWIRLELETNGTGSYEQESSALWICWKACIEKKETNSIIWLEWAKIETKANGAGDYETENSALWIYRKACLEEKVSGYSTIWQEWAKLEAKTNGTGSYETENSAFWIHRERCIEKEVRDHGLWLSWAKLELDKNGAGSYETENSALWIYRKACMEMVIVDQGLWSSWAKLELNMNGAGGYEIENSALWIYREVCANKNVKDSATWAKWASLEEKTNGAGSYEMENSALWIYQEAYYRGYVLAPSLWLGWARIVESNRIPDSEWTVENIYQQALEETKWELNVAMAYADYLMNQGQFTCSREICHELFVQEKYRVLLKLLIIETVAGNIDPDSEFSVPQIMGTIEHKYASSPRMINILYIYYRLQKEKGLSDKYYEMLVFPMEEIEELERASEEFMIKCKEAYAGEKRNEILN